MPRANDAVEAMLIEYAALLSILFEDPYKPRAYEKAARAVGGHPVDLEGKELPEILHVPSVGTSIGEKVHEFLTTGRVAELDVPQTFIEALRPLRQVRRIDYAGSLRRMKETIGDVDLLVASADAGPIMDAFVVHPSVSRVLANGETKSSVLTELGLQVDLRVVPKEAWGAAMIYFTGSKPHNIRIREMAVKEGLKLNEYGLFDAKSGDLLAAETEEAVYERLGMAYVEPTLREDRGEVEAALAGELPALFVERQLKGDLHT